MYRTDFESLPLQLWRRPVNDPWQLIEAFVQFTDYNGSKKLLQQWYRAAISEAYIPAGKSPGSLHFFTERLESLVFAALLLHKKKQRKGMADDAVAAYGSIAAFFSYQSWPQWRLALHQWQAAAMSRYSICEVAGPGALLPFCSHINRLVKTMYGLHAAYTNRGRLQLPAAMQPVLKSLTALLQPEKVFALHGGGYTSLLVVLPDTNHTSFKAFDELVSLAAIRHPKLSVSLHKAAAIAQRLSQGHAWYSRVCTPAQLVYDTGTGALPCTAPEKMAALDREAAAVFKSTFTPATGFLHSARQALRQKNWVYGLFLLHQAAELSLRAVTLALTGHEIKTHEIRQLRLHAARCAPELLLPFDNNEKTDDLLLLLDNAYSQARYNPAFAAGKKEVKELYSKIERLLLLAAERFK